MALSPEGLVAAMDAAQPQYEQIAKQYANKPEELARQCKLVWATALINYLKANIEVNTAGLGIANKSTNQSIDLKVAANTTIK